MATDNGKVALVTGAGRGIGRAIVRELAVQGYGIVINYVDRAEAAQETLAIAETLGAKAIAIQADVRIPEQLDRLFKGALERFGRLDVLINNAGVPSHGLLGQITAADLDRTLEINFKGAMFATQRAVAAFGEGGGAVVNLGSALVGQPVATQAVYAASKAAVETLTRALAQELGPRQIRVNAVSPGPVQTDALQIDEGTRAYIRQRTALGRLGAPEDVAKVVAFLVSDAAAWITGQVIGVDGGLRL